MPPLPPARPRRVVLAVVGTLALFVVVLGITRAHACSSELDRARQTCAAVRPGAARAAAERALGDLGAADLGGTLAGPGGPRTSYDYGIRGSVVSWECSVAIDPADRVTHTGFTAWMVNDFHGRWDDGANEWIEAHWL